MDWDDATWISLLLFIASANADVKKEIFNQKSYRNDCDVCAHGTETCLLTIRECAREGFQKAEKDEVIKRLCLNVYPSEDAKANMIRYLLEEFGYVYEKEDK